MRATEQRGEERDVRISALQALLLAILGITYVIRGRPDRRRVEHVGQAGPRMVVAAGPIAPHGAVVVPIAVSYGQVLVSSGRLAAQDGHSGRIGRHERSRDAAPRRGRRGAADRASQAAVASGCASLRRYAGLCRSGCRALCSRRSLVGPRGDGSVRKPRRRAGTMGQRQGALFYSREKRKVSALAP